MFRVICSTSKGYGQGVGELALWGGCFVVVGFGVLCFGHGVLWFHGFRADGCLSI